ncbi:hypothetical protein [Micromonospora sp. DT233]|uniref:hypothetical protein n=1 Tax=Micromonospora sp. DT233 TaxID=3393432 RepID=UPI003CF62A3C
MTHATQPTASVLDPIRDRSAAAETPAAIGPGPTYIGPGPTFHGGPGASLRIGPGPTYIGPGPTFHGGPGASLRIGPGPTFAPGRRGDRRRAGSARRRQPALGRLRAPRAPRPGPARRGPAAATRPGGTVGGVG